MHRFLVAIILVSWWCLTLRAAPPVVKGRSRLLDGTLSDVHERMEFSRRRLAEGDPGSQTRQLQGQIVEILGQLIQEAAQREASSSSGASSPGQAPGQPGESASQSPGEGQQGGPTGGRSKGTDTAAIKRAERGGPQSEWSKLREKERAAVYSAIKEKFPARYQQLLEQYYQSFLDEPKD